MPETSFRRNLKSVATLALPLALTQLSQHSMSFVDTVFIGRVGELELASTALGSSLFFTTCIIGFGILHGLDTIIAQAFGRQEPDSARRALVQGTYLAFIWSFLTAGVAWLLTYATRFIGTDLRIAEGALEYMEGRLPSILPMFLVVALRSFLQGAHITRPILSAAIIANIVNLILDALVLLGPSYAFQFGWISENWNMEFGPLGISGGQQYRQLRSTLGDVWPHQAPLSSREHPTIRRAYSAPHFPHWFSAQHSASRGNWRLLNGAHPHFEN